MGIFRFSILYDFANPGQSSESEPESRPDVHAILCAVYMHVSEASIKLTLITGSIITWLVVEVKQRGN